MEFRLQQEDERSYSLQITEIDADGGPDHLTLWLDHEEAVDLFMAVEKGIGSWVADFRCHEALYKATKHQHEDEQDAFDPADPKSPGYADRMFDAADQARKSFAGVAMSVNKLVVGGDGLVRMREYRLWVNDERTLLVRLWEDQGDGQLEVATRPSTGHTWGPPVILTEEKIR